MSNFWAILIGLFIPTVLAGIYCLGYTDGRNHERSEELDRRMEQVTQELKEITERLQAK